MATLENIENHTLKVLQLAITFLIRTYAHAKKKDSIPEFTSTICDLLQAHAPTSQWLLSKYVKEFFPCYLLVLFHSRFYFASLIFCF